MKTQEISLNAAGGAAGEKTGKTGKKGKKGNKQIKKKRRLIWLKYILLFILCKATIVCLALSPLFNITGMKVGGSKHYKDSRIIDLTGIITGNNGFKTIGSGVTALTDIFTLRHGKAERSIADHCPYVKTVVVRFALPSTIKIDITERKPVGIVPATGADLVIDDEGQVLEVLAGQTAPGLPSIKGLKFKGFTPGRKLELSNPEAMDAYKTLVAEIAKQDAGSSLKILKLMSSVDLGNPDKICFGYDSRIIVNFGDLRNLDYRLKFFRQIAEKNLGMEDKGFLDMTVKDPVLKP